MAKLSDVVQNDSCFQPGSTLCMGCMESISFQNIGKLTDNGKKTIFAMGTFCGEVSTLQYPDVVAWGRGEATPEEWSKSFGILHHVFESAPSVAEGIRDTADALTQLGAMKDPIQVLSMAGDGGSLSIGLRTLLHTINRGPKVTIFVMVNEIFANTGFQYSPVTPLGAETSTTPTSDVSSGNTMPPLNYIGLALMAGAGFVAQVSPAYPKYFIKAVEKALECPTTSIIFVPTPCITGWKFAEGETVKLAQLACETGFFPSLMKERGKKGEIKFVEMDPAKRPAIEEFMGPQRRFYHLVEKDKETGAFKARAGKEEVVKNVGDWLQKNLVTLQSLMSLETI